MRFLTLSSCLALLLVASPAVAIPPSGQIKSYKSSGMKQSGVANATPSFSPAQSNQYKRPGVSGGASASDMYGRRRPGSPSTGSMLPGGGNFERPQRGPNSNYRPDRGQLVWGQAVNTGPGSNYAYVRPGYRPDYRPDYRPGGNRPNVVINRPQTNINNTTIINQNNFNRPGYGYSYNNYASSLPYYSRLHYHWQPSVWSSGYQPAYYNYGYSSVGGSWLSVGGSTISYVNPFYAQTGSAAQINFDYSQPIRVPDSSYRETEDDLILSELAVRRFDDARQFFRLGEYGRASELIDEAIELLPNDPTLHQFRALVLFARGQYPEAAAVLYSVLAVSPGWDAATVAKLYDPPSRYLTQLNQLAQYAASHPESIDSQFLLAYHYAVRGDMVKAERQLAQVDEARPGDRVVESLLTALRR